MPIYEYRCRNGHNFEVRQSMSDDPVTACEQCQAPVERVFHPIAVHFKGSGFYTTDYAKKGSAAESGDGGGSKSDATKSDSASKSESSSSGSSSKSDSGSSGSSGSSSKSDSGNGSSSSGKAESSPSGD